MILCKNNIQKNTSHEQELSADQIFAGREAEKN